MKAPVLFVLPLLGFIIHGAKAQEYYGPQKFVVVIKSCPDNDIEAKCEDVRLPFDADNEVQCQMTSWVTAQKYGIEHHRRVVSWHCMKAAEHDI